VWAMPEGTSLDPLLPRARELADAILARGLNLSTRLHILLWGAAHGR
jgi:7-carboxy-7-deazaguanine synthase